MMPETPTDDDLVDLNAAISTWVEGRPIRVFVDVTEEPVGFMEKVTDIHTMGAHRPLLEPPVIPTSYFRALPDLDCSTCAPYEAGWPETRF